MTTAPPGWRPEADPQALIREARRRQRRRHVAVGLALAVILGGASGIMAGLTGTGGHSPGGLGRSPGRTPSPGAFAQSALPPFFADAVTTGEANESLQVRVAASGGLVAQEENMAGVSGLAAAGPDSFVIALQRLLAFTGWNVAGNGLNTGQFVRVLPTDAPAGTAAERSQVVLSRPDSGPELAAATLSPSGASFYLCTQTESRTGLGTNVAWYRTSTGELQQDLASLRGAPEQMGCSMALDSSGRFLLVPYSLDPASHPALKAAEIDIATRAVKILTLRLPPDGGMDPPTGMIAAW